MEKHTVSSKQAAIEDLKAIINIEDYPLTDRDSAAYRQVINRLRNQLAEDGCAHVAKDQIGTDKIIRRLYTHHWQNYSNNDKL